MMFYHLDYEIDKKLFQKHFWDNYTRGEWHQFKEPKLIWWKVFDISHLTETVERELNIHGMNNHPRFSYQFPNTRLPEHKDEDNIVAINLNLMDKNPIIHINGLPFTYNSAVINVGQLNHSVEPDPNERLILKFAIRHSWEEVMERLDKLDLIIPFDLP